MAQALVNKSLDNLVMGVSQQYQEGRIDGQVQELVNCIPSVTRGVLRRNPVKDRKTLSALNGVNISNAFTYAYDRGNGDEQYILIIPGDASGSWFVYNINDETKHWSGTNNYFKVPAGVKAKDVFKAITLRDATFILNTTVKVKASTATNSLNLDLFTKTAFYWIKSVTQVVVAQKTVDDVSGSRLVGYTYTLNGKTVQGVYEGRPGETPVDRLSADKIADELAEQLGPSYTSDAGSSFVYHVGNTVPNWDCNDSNGLLSSLGVWQAVPSANELPAVLPAVLDGFIVAVTGGTSAHKDDYYLQYSHEYRTWNEVAHPGELLGLDASTMPHVLYRNFSGTVSFNVQPYTWENREVGDITTNPDPSFVGNTINDLFFYKNRLGFLSRNTAVLSTIKGYGSFYIRTLRTILDDGPIDLTIATTNTVNLRTAVTTDDTLVLFDSEAQFLLHSNNQPLTPITATITALSHYSYNIKMGAQAVGNTIMFTSTSGKYAQIFSMRLVVNEYDKINAEAQNISQHLPTYIDKYLNGCAIDTGIGQIFFQTGLISNKLYVLNTAKAQGEDVQQAFHTWLFDWDIVGIHTINDKLYILFNDGSLGNIELLPPGDISTIVYADEKKGGGYKNYTSVLEFSQFYYKGQSNKGSLRGRTQIRTLEYSLADKSYYKTFLSNKLTYKVEKPDGTISISPPYVREYSNDSKVTVMSGTDNTVIVFSSNDKYPTKGFELQTVNVEMLFYQRSSRVIS